MFVGHALLAVALAGGLARLRGLAPERALAVAAVAGLFAAVPDVDVLYAPVALAISGADPSLEAFWGAAAVTHRAVTHSLVLAVPVAAGATLVRSHRGAAALVLGAVVLVSTVVSGALAGTMAALFVVAAAGVGLLAAALDVDRRWTVVAALVGLLSHPFGDLFTGGPPAFFYPLEVPLVGTRVAPFADPTHDLFLAFGVELGAIWAGVLVAAALAGISVRAHVRPRAAVGAAFAVSVFVLPNPTVDAAYGFVAGVLTTGAVGGVRPGERLLTWVLTGLAAVTVGGVAFALAYVA